MPHNKNLSYQFGPYQLDLSQRVLSRNGETLSLTPKATEILVKLVTNAGQLVEKDELLREVWPDTFVEEASLSQNIFLLRRTLGDERGGPRFIETVTRRGYRFVADVSVVGAEEQQGEDLRLVAVVAPRTVVAVLPFLNTTGDPELEYLADGVTDNIINNLCRVSQLRVMSHSAVGRYKLKTLDPQQVGRDLGASSVLVGRIHAVGSAMAVSVELVQVSTGWQLWGESFDSQDSDILEIQDAITRQMLATLKLKLTGEEEQRVTARYTENVEAYQLYLEGRYHWSRYTRTGMEKAIGHFRKAIELDPNYALAYAAIVDCYLRLATNYLPPEEDVPTPANESSDESNRDEEESRVRLRFEWDWKGVERELRRAYELKTSYPSAHQWYAAYRFAKAILKRPVQKDAETTPHELVRPTQFFSSSLTPNEEVQIFCAITREQIEIGNYDAGYLMLRKWWVPGEWPRLDGLSSYAAADLLFTSGSLMSCLSSTGRFPKGQRHAEDLLSGSIGIFEHLGAKRRSAEARIELALCYYRQGMFSLSRDGLLRVLIDLQPSDNELRSLGLIRLGVVERHSGHLSDSICRFSEAHCLIDENGPLVTGRYYHELATVLQENALANQDVDCLETVSTHLQRAFREFIAIGHHRYAAVVENNHGFLLLRLGRFKEAEIHLIRARSFFEAYHDRIRRAQVEDTLARLYLDTGRLDESELASRAAVTSLEDNDEEALLTEALTTRGILLCRLKRHSEARIVLEGARRIAERCGDSEGAGRVLLVLIEEMSGELGKSECGSIATLLQQLLEFTQASSTRLRVENCLRVISNSWGEV